MYRSVGAPGLGWLGLVLLVSTGAGCEVHAGGSVGAEGSTGQQPAAESAGGEAAAVEASTQAAPGDGTEPAIARGPGQPVGVLQAGQGDGGGGAEAAGRGPAAAAEADPTPVSCRGNDRVTRTAVEIENPGGTCVTATGNCTVHLSDCTLSGALAIDASGNAEIHLDGCTVEGVEAAIVASGNARIHAPAGNELDGEVELDGNAEIVRDDR